MFKNYNQYLESDFSVDFWSDEGIDYAISLLNTFTSSDWIKLTDSCKVKPIHWVIRCVETLGDSLINKEQSFDLLLLSQSGNREIMIAALDSINSLASLGLNISLYSDRLSNVLFELKGSTSHVEEMVFSSLEKKLKE